MVVCVLEMWEEPCRLVLWLGVYACVSCVSVCSLCVFCLLFVCVCVPPCLTTCCLFAAVYIYCTVYGCKADHSREQTVFTESFALRHCSCLLFFVFNPLPNILNTSSFFSVETTIICIAWIAKKNKKSLLSSYYHKNRNITSVVPAAVKRPHSSQSVHSQYRLIMNHRRPFKHHQWINWLNYSNQDFLNVGAK